MFFLVRSLNTGYKKEQLSCTQKQGVITLIPKGKKPKEHIKNWRPISLLNTTFKILSRVMANRMRLVIDKLIGHEQKGFMKGRFIGECTRMVYDIMWEVNHSRNSGNVILVHGRKVIIHWPHAKFLPLINRSVNQHPEVIIHC